MTDKLEDTVYKSDISFDEAVRMADEINALIDRYNAEHAEPEKVGEPCYDDVTGKWYQILCNPGIARKGTCNVCCFDKLECNNNCETPTSTDSEFVASYCVFVDPPETETPDVPEDTERTTKLPPLTTGQAICIGIYGVIDAVMDAVEKWKSTQQGDA